MRFCVLLALAVQCFTQETQEMNIPEGQVDAQTTAAAEAEMLARLTPEQKKQHEDFMAEKKVLLKIKPSPNKQSEHHCCI